jgi:adenylate cyclase class 2
VEIKAVSLEQELKFVCVDFDALRKSLIAGGAEFADKVFEHNRVYDTEHGQLRKAGTLLRLREAGKAVLCVKSQPENRTQDRGYEVKTWEEDQTQVCDPESMHSILQGLGYQVVFSYQKVREKWRLGQCVVCLDQLPFGRFVEIEGKPEEIWAQARNLGLDEKPWSTKSYYDLHQDWRAQNHLPLDESFVFTPEEEAGLRAAVQNGAPDGQD